MISASKTLLYGTNVFHYEHVLMAMRQVSTDITLIRRSEIEESTLTRLEQLPIPRRAVSMLRRRSVRRDTKAAKEYNFGLEQYIHPLNRIMHRKTSRKEYRLLTKRMAQRVAREAEQKTIIHFVEGLGHIALTQRRDTNQLFICERRGIHPETWRHPREPHYDMPVRFREDPILDMLETEFASSDKIVVYSSAAKATFVKQGIETSKIHVVPLPIPRLGPKLHMTRKKSQILFVGRGDLDKGIDVAVSVLERLGAPHELVVAGPFSQKMADWLCKFPFVKYLGPVDKAKLQRLYAESTILLLPSIESFGYVLIEATNAGLPVVCSDQTGASEYVQGPLVTAVHGFESKVWAESVSQAVDRSNRGLVEDLQSLSRLSLPNVVQDWKHLYT